MQRPSPIYPESHISSVSPKVVRAQVILNVRYTRWAQCRNEHTGSEHFLLLARTLGAKSNRRSSLQFQGCFVFTNMTGSYTDLGCTSSTQAIRLHIPGWNYFGFPTTIISRVSKMKNSLHIYCQVISTRYLHHDVNCDWMQKSAKTNAETRLRDGSGGISVITTGHQV